MLIGNLPNAVTLSLLEILSHLSFRTTVLAVGELTNLDKLRPIFNWSEVCPELDDEDLAHLGGYRDAASLRSPRTCTLTMLSRPNLGQCLFSSGFVSDSPR